MDTYGHGGESKIRVVLETRYDIAYWCIALEASEAEIANAIDHVGTHVADVTNYLWRQRYLHRARSIRVPPESPEP